MKLSVIYHSESGNTKKVAELIANSAQDVKNIDAIAMSIDSLNLEFLADSKAVIFGCPIYAAGLSWQMKKFFDTTPFTLLNGKLGATFTTARIIGGGGALGELNMITAMLVKGMLVYSSGSAEGQPFTHLGAVCIQDGDEEQKQRVQIFTKRIAKKALELFEK